MPKAKTMPKTAKKQAFRKSAPPRWDLSHLVAEPVDKHVAAALAAGGKAAESFRRRFEGKLGKLGGKAFGKAFAEYEDICEKLARVGSYLSLDRQTKLDDPVAGKKFQSYSEKANDIFADLLFFRLEINRLPEKTVRGWMKDKETARYKSVIAQIRAFRDYQLSDEVEKILHDRDVTGSDAWVRMFDETVARLRFPVGKKMLTETEVFHLLLSRNAKTRKAAHQSIGKVFSENIGAFSFIYNTLVKEKEIDDRQRGYKSPMAARNLDNQVEDEVVHALVAAVKKSYPKLSHRYYKLKAKWMRQKKLNPWDRNAPLPFAAEKKFSWDQARDAVLTAYGRFHPGMEKIGRRFFDEKWIDAEPRAGKDSGAFSASTVPSVHPYILMNFKGGVDDVATLAHELGHGVHQVLAGKQGYFMADTPLTLAETASVFGEMLTFQSLLAAEKNPKARKAMLAGKVEDMLNTVVRQIAFHDFEQQVHAARKNGELTPEDFAKIWMQVMRESLGPAFTFDEAYKNFWAYIPHFYHTPFYVYAYAFGDCLVNALYAVYQDSEKRGDHSFADKYMDLLAAGGTARHDVLLQPFGLSAKDPSFWQRGLGVIESFIDQLEKAENLGKVSKRRKKAVRTKTSA